MSITNKPLKRRIIEISYKKKLSHLGSVLTAVDIIKEIYDIKKPDEKFVLSSGHAALALYVVNEASDGRNAEEAFDHHGVHPDRCKECSIYVSAGSLGHGIGIAVGIALADRNKNVYCLISDGECAEGSLWEALRIQRQLRLDNLIVYLNYNGWSAYQESNPFSLIRQIDFPAIIRQTNVDYLPFLKGQIGHYKVMDETDHQQAMGILK